MHNKKLKEHVIVITNNGVIADYEVEEPRVMGDRCHVCSLRNICRWKK